jgi:hypothetical protein
MNRLLNVLKGNPNHGEHGRFASGSSTGAVKNIGRIDKKALKEVEAWGGERAKYAAAAVNAIGAFGGGKVIRDAQGRLQGIASVDITTSGEGIRKQLADAEGIKTHETYNTGYEKPYDKDTRTTKEYDKFSHDNMENVEIGFMATAPGTSGNGRKLFESVLQEAAKRNAGFGKFLTVGADQHAIGFWKKMGFKPLGKAESYRHPDFGKIKVQTMYMANADIVKRVGLKKAADAEPLNGIYCYPVKTMKQGLRKARGLKSVLQFLKDGAPGLGESMWPVDSSVVGIGNQMINEPYNNPRLPTQPRPGKKKPKKKSAEETGDMSAARPLQSNLGPNKDNKKRGLKKVTSVLKGKDAAFYKDPKEKDDLTGGEYKATPSRAHQLTPTKPKPTKKKPYEADMEVPRNESTSFKPGDDQDANVKKEGGSYVTVQEQQFQPQSFLNPGYPPQLPPTKPNKKKGKGLKKVLQVLKDGAEGGFDQARMLDAVGSAPGAPASDLNPGNVGLKYMPKKPAKKAPKKTTAPVVGKQSINASSYARDYAKGKVKRPQSLKRPQDQKPMGGIFAAVEAMKRRKK